MKAKFEKHNPNSKKEIINLFEKSCAVTQITAALFNVVVLLDFTILHKDDDNNNNNIKIKDNETKPLYKNFA